MSVNHLRAVLASPEPTNVTDRLVLITYAWHANEEGRSWPSSGTLMAETGLSRASFFRSKKRLQKSGLIESTTGSRGSVMINVDLLSLFSEALRESHSETLEGSKQSHSETPKVSLRDSKSQNETKKSHSETLYTRKTEELRMESAASGRPNQSDTSNTQLLGLFNKAVYDGHFKYGGPALSTYTDAPNEKALRASFNRLRREGFAGDDIAKMIKNWATCVGDYGDYAHPWRHWCSSSGQTMVRNMWEAGRANREWEQTYDQDEETSAVRWPMHWDHLREGGTSGTATSPTG